MFLGSYFDNSIDNDSVSNRNNPFYAHKLDAAMQAWHSISQNPKLSRGISVKKAIIKWLTDNAETYNLRLENGELNKSAIQGIAKIVNWKPEGGATATPTTIQIEKSTVKKDIELKSIFPSKNYRDLDDDIPF